MNGAGSLRPRLATGGKPAAKEDDLGQCLRTVGKALAEGALDPVSVAGELVASVTVGAGYEVRKYNKTSGGTMGKRKLAPPGGAVNRVSIAKVGGIVAAKLFFVATAIVAVGNAAYVATTSEDC